MGRFVALLALVFFSGSAVASDLPLKAPFADRYWPGVNWNGVYAGIAGGLGAGSLHGGLGTITAGINLESYSRFLFGAEADFSVGSFDGNGACANACSFKSRWMTTVRARAGYNIGKVLFFGTAGLATGDVQVSNPAGAPSSATRSGFAIGGGAEFDLTQNWSARVDYLHVDLGHVNCGTICGSSGPSFRATSDIFRVGLVYRFFQEAVEEFSVLGPPIKPPPFDAR